jgi:hypothetical protein
MAFVFQYRDVGICITCYFMEIAYFSRYGLILPLDYYMVIYVFTCLYTNWLVFCGVMNLMMNCNSHENKEDVDNLLSTPYYSICE